MGLKQFLKPKTKGDRILLWIFRGLLIFYIITTMFFFAPMFDVIIINVLLKFTFLPNESVK